MADKEARVRLTLNNSGFLGGLRQTTDEVKRQGNAMAEAFHKPLLGGLDSAKKSLTNLGSEAKNVAKFGLALGGSFTLAEAAKGAFSLQSNYKNLAFAIRAGTGEAVKWQDIQATIESGATLTKQRNDAMAQSFRDIYEETGNLQFTNAAVVAAGKAATTTGREIGIFAALAGTAFEKFNVGADQIDQVLSSIYSFGTRGGLSVEEIASRFGQMGASAKAAGASGVEGISRILGMATMADDSLGNMRQKITAVTGLLDELANPDQMKKIGKELHLNLVDKKGNVRGDALDQIIAKTGGDAQKINQVLSGPTAKLVSAFGKLYKDGFEGSDKKGKGKVQDGLDALHDSLTAAAKSNIDQATWDKQFADKSNTAKAAMTQALNDLENAFAKPEMIDAMKTMAQITPKLASGVAKLLEAVVSHPLLAGSAAIGGKIAIDAAGGVAASLASSLGKRIVAEVMAQKITVVAKPIVDGLGMVIGKEFVTVAAAATPWQNAGKLAGAAMGIAVGAYLVEKFGQWLIDKGNEQKADIQNTAGVGVAVSGTGDKNQIAPALKRAREALKIAEAEARATSRMGMGGGMGMGAAGYSGEVIETTEVKAAREAVRELEAAMSKTSNGGDKVTRSLNNLGTAIDSAAQKLNKLGNGSGGDGSNGPPPSPGNAPGYG